ncbi:MAG: hypothetical protein ACETVR_03150 [Candidatus Bathyarchaeia archaeon]
MSDEKKPVEKPPVASPVTRPVVEPIPPRPPLVTGPKRPMCVNHPEVPAAGVCSRCNKPYCSGDLTYYKGSLLCLNCLKRSKTMSLVTSIASVGVVIGFFAVIYVYLMPTIISFIQNLLP